MSEITETSSPVKLGDDLTPRELELAALDLEQLLLHPGWKVLMQLVDRYRMRVGSRGIRDPKRPRAYYVGLCDGPDAVFEQVAVMVQNVKDKRKVEKQASQEIAGRYGRGTVGNVTAE